MANSDEKYGRPRIKRRVLVPTLPPESEKPEVPAAEDERRSPQAVEAPRPAPRRPPVRPREAPAGAVVREEVSKRETRPRPAPAPREKERRPKTWPKRKKISAKKPAKKVKVSVVVPAYNEADNVFPLAEQFNAMFREAKFSGEVIFVDDGSTDRTLLAASQCQNRYPFFRVLTHRKNRGLTAALETGFRQARGEIFVFYPADLQYHPDDIPRLVQKLEASYDIVTGWRQGKYGLKRFVSSVYNSTSRWLFGLKVHDLNSVKAFRKEVFSEIPLRRDWHRYMVVLGEDKGYKLGEVKVKLYPRRHGRSKFGASRILVGFFDLLAVKLQLTFLKKPMLYFGTAGSALTFLGILIGLLALYFRFILNEGYRPLLYLVMLLTLGGISLFVLGLLAEAITGLREDIERLKKR